MRAVGPQLQHRGAVLQADFSPDGRTVVTASYDMTAQRWDVQTGAKLGPPLRHPNADNGPVYTAKFSSDGQRVVTASYDRSAQVWDARTGTCVQLLWRAHRCSPLFIGLERGWRVLSTWSLALQNSSTFLKHNLTIHRFSEGLLG